ncbi:MAG: TIGR02300 family protein [Myxococcota bacterium]|nr:TIGR02300 family protein [Myxococcota bacterium]
MAAKDLGNKFVCFKCQAKFYDLKKPDPLCPKCGADQRESPALRPAPEGRRGRGAAKAAVIAAVEPEADEAPVAASEDEEAEEFEDEDVEIPATEDEEV